MKGLIAFLVVLVSSYPSYGQEVWEFPNHTQIRGFAADENGIYIAGSSSQVFEGFPHEGEIGVFLARVNSSGGLEWVKQWGTQEYDGMGLRGLAAHNGVVYLNYYLNDPLGLGDGNVYVGAWDQDGNQLWETQIGTGLGTDLFVDESGIYAANSLYNLVKLNFQGSIIWQVSRKLSLGLQASTTKGIAADQEGNVYVAGWESEPEEPPKGFLARYDPNGILQWDRFVETEFMDFMYGIDMNLSGIHVIGSMNFALLFVGGTHPGKYFLNQYDFSGNLVSSIDSLGVSFGGGDVVLGPAGEEYITFQQGAVTQGHLQKREGDRVVWDVERSGMSITLHKGILYLVDGTNEIRRYDAETGGTPQQPPPPEPQIFLSPATIEFGGVRVGQRTEKLFLISNSGNAPLVIASIRTGSTTFAVSAGDRNVSPGGSREEMVRFIPEKSGKTGCIIVIESNAPTSPDTIQVFGLGTQAQLELGVREIDFGRVDTNAAKDTTSTFRNAGNDTLLVYRITSNNPAFTIPQSSNLALLPEQSVLGTVRFAPLAGGPYTGLLVMESNAPTSPDTIKVSGFGTAPTGIDEEASPVAPQKFGLGQNHPNPFNPSTIISYEVPKQAHVTLVVYNILGQEVVRLVDEIKQPGRYEIVWNASQMPSGVYFYRMTSDSDFSTARRMTLIK